VHGTALSRAGCTRRRKPLWSTRSISYAIVWVCYLVLKGRAQLGSLTLWMLIIGYLSRFAQPASLGL